MSLSFDGVRTTLGLDDSFEAWRSSFGQSAALLDDAEPLPQGAALRALCRELRLPELVIEPLVESAADLETNPSLRRVHAHSRWMLRHEVPRIGSWSVPWGQLPARLGQTARLLHAFTFLSEVPRIRRQHDALGIADEISVDTLSDLGLHLRHYHRMYDGFGFEEPAWMGLHFAGLLFRLGRLQFELGTWRVPVHESASCPLALGDPILDVHIPELGPLTPGACDDSVERAKEFFGSFFPDFDFHAFGCWSWLLDPQLAEYLEPGSNIMRFQHRFHGVRTAERHDGSAVKFVFRRHPDTPLGELPRQTLLQRAILDHLSAGRRWDFCLGYFET